MHSFKHNNVPFLLCAFRWRVGFLLYVCILHAVPRAKLSQCFPNHAWEAINLRMYTTGPDPMDTPISFFDQLWSIKICYACVENIARKLFENIYLQTGFDVAFHLELKE